MGRGAVRFLRHFAAVSRSPLGVASKALIIVIAGVACGTTSKDAEGLRALTDAGGAAEPEFDDGFVRLSEAIDRDARDGVVRIALTARSARLELVGGVAHRHATYDGLLPGPLLRGKRGDRLIIDFQNDLDVPTTIHWHGLRVPNDMDGVPDVTQPSIPPGEGFRYEYALSDAGLYWYHPHFQTLDLVGDGLYGALLVDDPDEPKGLGEQTVIALSDVSLLPDGSVEPHPEGADTQVLGREGATVLVNGRTNQRMRVQSGSRLRWRVVNMARSRYFELSLPGHEFLRIGDDAGPMQFPVTESTVRLAPGERADLVVEPRGEAGDTLDLVTLPVYRGTGASSASEPLELVQLEFVDGEASVPRLPRLRRELEAFPTEGAEEIELALTMDVVDGEARMGLDWEPPLDDHHRSVKPGERQIWNVVNHTSYAHPFHLHGFHFQVLDARGRHESPLRYQDTVDIAPRETLRIVPRFDDRPGMWMFHCHILDHAEAGMMNHFEVRR